MHTLAADTTPAPAPEPASYYRLEARPWGGPWCPAIAGPLNCTGDDDDTASTFATVPEAMGALDRVVLPSRPLAVRLVRSDGVVLYSATFPRHGR